MLQMLPLYPCTMPVRRGGASGISFPNGKHHSLGLCNSEIFRSEDPDQGQKGIWQHIQTLMGPHYLTRLTAMALANHSVLPSLPVIQQQREDLDRY